jgi:hypothetical protein
MSASPPDYTRNVRFLYVFDRWSGCEANVNNDAK